MLKVVLLVTLLFFFPACGRQTIDVGLESQVEVPIESVRELEGAYLAALELTPVDGTVTVKAATFFKKTKELSSNLSNSQKCSLSAGRKLDIIALGEESSGHVFVSLKDKVNGCEFKDGYFYKAHVEIKHRPVYSLVVASDTKFKVRNADSSTLSASEFCVVPAGKVFIERPAEDVGNHIKVTLKSGQVACGFVEGYFYKGHLSEYSPSPDNSFSTVMKHILAKEGGCSDDPNDYGGRTYKGITTARARQNGWTADVCTMPHSMVLDIYSKDYWKASPHPYRFAWPMNLAVMNTSVNSGPGRAQRFLDRMVARQISGTTEDKARWFVDQQTDFYYQIVENDASQRKFLRGWLNRSNYMQAVISGQITFAFAFEPDDAPSAKAYETTAE